MKGIFLRALSLALLIPAAMVVAVDPVKTVTEVAKAATETVKTAEVSRLTKAWNYTSAKAKDFGSYVSTKGQEAYTLASNNKLATAGIVAATAATGYGLYRAYRHFYPKSEDKNVASSKAAGVNDLAKPAQVPTIKVEVIQHDIDLLNKMIAAANKGESLYVQKGGKLVFDLESLEAVKQIVSKNKKTNAQEAGLVPARLAGYVKAFDADKKGRKAEFVTFVSHVVSKLNAFKDGQKVEAPKAEAKPATPAVAAAKTAAPAAATTSDAKQTTWETVKSYATLKTAAVVTATAATLGLGYYYFPAIKAALGFGGEVAKTAAVAVAAKAVTPSVEATSNVAPQAVAKK